MPKKSENETYSRINAQLPPKEKCYKKNETENKPGYHEIIP
jgi:hypothetical protein